MRTWTAGSSADVLSANYRMMYRLTTGADPEGAAVFRLEPASADGFYPANSDVIVSVQAKPEHRFRYWEGALSGITGWGVVTIAVHYHLRGHVAAFCAALAVCALATRSSGELAGALSSLARDLAELARAASLFLVAVLGSRFAGDTFAVWDLRFVGGKSHLELGLCAVQGNVNVLVAHALQNGLVGDAVVVPGEGHILFAETGQGRGDLGGIGLGLGSYGNAIQGRWILGCRDGQGMALVAEGVASGGNSQLRDCGDVACMHDLGRDLFLAALEMQARHALFGALVLVPHVRIRLDRAGEHPEVGHLADERIGCGLPDVGSQRCRIGRLKNLFAIPALGHALACLQWRGHQVHDGVKKREDANLASACRAEDRDELSGADNVR